jgi:hypothetical protein
MTNKEFKKLIKSKASRREISEAKKMYLACKEKKAYKPVDNVELYNETLILAYDIGKQKKLGR